MHIQYEKKKNFSFSKNHFKKLPYRKKYYKILYTFYIHFRYIFIYILMVNQKFLGKKGNGNAGVIQRHMFRVVLLEKYKFI